MLKSEQKLLREGYVELCGSIKPNYAMTLKAGLDCQPDVLKRAARIFVCQVLRQARGRNWAKWPSNQWPTIIGFLEHPETDMHLQSISHLPTPDLEQAFSDAAPIWRKIRPGGHFYCESIQHDGYRRYVAKDSFKTDAHGEPFIFYRPQDYPDIL